MPGYFVIAENGNKVAELVLPVVGHLKTVKYSCESFVIALSALHFALGLEIGGVLGGAVYYSIGGVRLLADFRECLLSSNKLGLDGSTLKLIVDIVAKAVQAYRACKSSNLLFVKSQLMKSARFILRDLSRWVAFIAARVQSQKSPSNMTPTALYHAVTEAAILCTAAQVDLSDNLSNTLDPSVVANPFSSMSLSRVLNSLRSLWIVGHSIPQAVVEVELLPLCVSKASVSIESIHPMLSNRFIKSVEIPSAIGYEIIFDDRWALSPGSTLSILGITFDNSEESKKAPYIKHEYIGGGGGGGGGGDADQIEEVPMELIDFHKFHRLVRGEQLEMHLNEYFDGIQRHSEEKRVEQFVPQVGSLVSWVGSGPSVGVCRGRIVSVTRKSTDKAMPATSIGGGGGDTPCVFECELRVLPIQDAVLLVEHNSTHVTLVWRSDGASGVTLCSSLFVAGSKLIISLCTEPSNVPTWKQLLREYPDSFTLANERSSGGAQCWGFGCQVAPILNAKKVLTSPAYERDRIAISNRLFLTLQTDLAIVKFVDEVSTAKKLSRDAVLALNWADVVSSCEDLNKHPTLLEIAKKEFEDRGKNSLISSTDLSASDESKASAVGVGGSRSIGGAGSGAGGLATDLEMTEEDYAMVCCIMEMGFGLEDATAAYFESDKNNEIAVSMLLEGFISDPSKKVHIPAPPRKILPTSVTATSTAAPSTCIDAGADAVDIPLAMRTCRALIARFDFIKQLNVDIIASLETVDFSQANRSWSVANAFSMGRCYIFATLKNDIVNTSLSKTEVSGSSKFELIISRSKAFKFASLGECDLEGVWSVFGQAFRCMHGMNSSVFRRKGQLWNTVLAGERAQDAGGPYRESWSVMCAELMSKSVPLLKLCPNGLNLTGGNRETWLLNADATTPTQLQMFSFLGKLMGIALRNKEYMDLFLSPIVWKLIVREEITWNDIKDVDKVLAGTLDKIKEAHSVFLSSPSSSSSAVIDDLDFTLSTIGGNIIELHSGGRGEKLTWDNCLTFCKEVEAFRIGEMMTVADAVRRGLLSQIPPAAISLMRGHDLEELVCGNPEVNMELLKSATDYQGFSASSSEVVWFWEIMEKRFTREDRKAFLKFVWGRTRLPLTREGFSNKFRLTRLDSG